MISSAAFPKREDIVGRSGNQSDGVAANVQNCASESMRSKIEDIREHGHAAET